MTRNEVINDINNIEDNGNNTALEVRKVLTDLLDFSDEGAKLNADNIKKTDENLNLLTKRVDDLEINDETQNTTISNNSANITTIESDIDLINNALNALGKPFHIWSTDSLLDLNGSSQLWYSFKGNVDTTCSFTFKIIFSDKANDTNQFSYRRSEINKSTGITNVNVDNLFTILKGNILSAKAAQIEIANNIFPIKGILSKVVKDRLVFTVPVTNIKNSILNTATMNIAFDFIKEGTFTEIRFIILGFNNRDSIFDGDEIFTSIHFHCPDFIFDIKS